MIMGWKVWDFMPILTLSEVNMMKFTMKYSSFKVHGYLGLLLPVELEKWRHSLYCYAS